ncbi:MAG TPA: amidohydrolase family protein [Spirochaetota bacterium]|nr:amidohydrolase family protein [Spirochaetota bacterium]HQF08984.1 amidohydrolase family protein [Spirochaetota bacterium]HQH98793.1 amidohydrolase family protein [Spirochaetota bacterium]HQJ72267.1 amidohydrolase family protein [Spirochaetota bacterium]
MIIDSHFHYDERMMTADVLIRKMADAGVARAALIACMNDPLPVTPHAAVWLLQRLLSRRPLRGLGKILSAHFTDDGITILGKNYAIYPDPDNGPVFALARKNPDAFCGWIFVNPRGKNDPVREIEKWKTSPGFVGIKAHPFWHRYPPAELVSAAEQAVRLDKPLLIHLGFGDHGNFIDLVDRVPGLKLILAHAAFPCYSDSWKLIRARPTVFVDLSAVAYVGEKIMKDVVAYLGAERCFFGTDGPYGPLAEDGYYDYSYIKKRIERLFPDERIRRMILGENFARVAGL